MSDTKTELELYADACRGDHLAFARLVDPKGTCCGRRILAASRVGVAVKVEDRARCAGLFEDAFQEALIAIWRQLPAFRHESSLCSWMYGVAYNHTRGYARQPARWYRGIDHAPIEEHTDSPALATESAFSEDADLADRLLREVARTNPVGAEALLHKFWGDRAQTEIAELLGVSNATISRAIAKAYDQAAQLLAAWNAP